MNITPRQFQHFSDLVYHECGINLHDGKYQLLTARLSKRLRETGITDVDEYINRIEHDQLEMMRFLDAVSTNHTFFFRENHHFDVLNRDHRHIWCAASSSGEEPYSIVIYCLEKGYRPNILATDISTKVLQMGKSAIYPLERARKIPPQVLRRYFKKGHGRWEGYIRVKDETRPMVTFKRFNLVTDSYPSEKYDVIFCRNVFIYFDNPTKEAVAERLYHALNTGGYFIIGGAESLNNIDHRFTYVKPSIYQKVGGR